MTALRVLIGCETSGIGRRRWQGEDGPHHHIIDPRTGTSARTCWTSVTVVAASAAAANTAACRITSSALCPAWGAAGSSA